MKQKDVIKADKFDLSMRGKFNQLNRRLKSKNRRKSDKRVIKKEVQDEKILST